MKEKYRPSTTETALVGPLRNPSTSSHTLKDSGCAKISFQKQEPLSARTFCHPTSGRALHEIAYGLKAL